ncbi:MAG: MFS family permease [Acidimicrobiales bacterium]|jgi:MFS family permease
MVGCTGSTRRRPDVECSDEGTTDSGAGWRRFRGSHESVLSGLSGLEQNAETLGDVVMGDDPSAAELTEAYQDEFGPIPTPSAVSAASALLVGFAFLMIGNGLGGSVVGIRAELENFNTVATGLIMAAYFGGFLVGSRLAFRLLGNVGHIRVFTALASLASTVALIQAIAVFPLLWAPARFLTGLCMAGLFVVAESWLNDIATPETRGRLLASYMIVSMGGMAIGQFLLTIADPRDVTLFIVASVLVSLAVLPIALSTTSAAPLAEPEPMSLRELLAIVPTGVTSMFFVGTAAGTLLGMGAVYATRVGLSSNQTAVFLTAPIVGAVAFQWPMGILADRFPRRGLIALGAVAAAVAPLVMTQLSDSSLAGTLVLFVVGGTMFPLYSLTIAYTNDWIPVSKMVAASSSLVMVNGAGAVVGPLLTAVLFHQFGTGAYYFVLAAAHGLLAVYIGYRIVAKDALPLESQRAWVPLSSRSTGAVAVVTRPLRVRQKP